jgi:ribose-phosphate pyrophosphokinase
MRYLNLTLGFTPFGLPGQWINHEQFVFPGGEPHVKLLDSFNKPQDVMITTRVNNSEDFMKLCIATEALYQSSWAGDNIQLFIPYFPGARQDRRMVPGEPLTVAIYAEAINERGYSRVEIYDPHSDVTPALLENCGVIDNHKLVNKAILDITAVTPDKLDLWGKESLYIVSPDAGAEKKIGKLAQALEIPNIITCSKVRDVRSGKLSGFKVHAADLIGKDLVIIDDICDGGGTFIGLAKELKALGAKDLYLIVSHGIFSKGLEELEQYFKTIYTTDSIFSADERYTDTYIAGGILKQFKLGELT